MTQDNLGGTPAKQLARGILDAMGIGGKDKRWERVVVVCDVTCPLPRVYVKGFVPDAAIAKIVEGVKNVTVSDDGDVTVEPLVAEASHR